MGREGGMGQIKTHGQEKREKDRDKKSCWEKKKKNKIKKKSGWVQQEESQELQGKGTGNSTVAQAAAGQGHSCLSPSLGSSPGTRGCFGSHGNSSGAFPGSQGCFYATPDPAAIRSGINHLPQEHAAAPASSPTNTTQVVFPAQLPLIS